MEASSPSFYSIMHAIWRRMILKRLRRTLARFSAKNAILFPTFPRLSGASCRISGSTMAEAAYDIAVIGGGIVGLATANALLESRPGLKLVLLEAEDRFAAHQTGHNSGVIHSGLYYKPGSKKAQYSVEGREAMYRF
jgi:NADPH-dependent 2,4-dienoyl-CoA reductase/sulfur reductase-like enzyme